LSDRRTEPFCSHYELCGGCKWQHIDYQLQIESKRQQVIDNFSRIGKFTFPSVNPIIPSERTQKYRNKLEYTFSNRRWLTAKEIQNTADLDRNGVGFHIPRHFDKIVDIQKCYLQKEPSNAIRNELRRFAIEEKLSFYDIKENKGLLRNLIIRTTSTDQLMVIVQFGEDTEEQIQKVMSHLASKFLDIDSLYYVVNLKKNETFHDLDTSLFRGQAYIEERLNELSFKLGPEWFFQTNSYQTELLYLKALEMAALNGEEIVYDLYCGTGTITNFLAKRAKKVVGIESVKEAVDDATENAKINGITNTSFVVGDIKDALDESFISNHGRPDVVISDPPRAGMHKDVIAGIMQLEPNKIVYISCNPATQARDLSILVKDYEILEIQPFDMFPHTHHLENIVSLVKR
jgi:23S rRNA (uracil1939-C5)-methyltransferase